MEVQYLNTIYFWQTYTDYEQDYRKTIEQDYERDYEQDYRKTIEQDNWMNMVELSKNKPSDSFPIIII